MPARITAAVGLVAFLLVAVVVWNAGRPRSGSQEGVLFADPSEVIIEQSSEANSGSARFEIALVNGTAQIVKLLDIRQTCACTLADPPTASVLQPGDRVTLVVNASLPTYGKRRSVITVSTDDTVNPTLQIPIVLKGREVPPPFVTFVSGEIRMRGTRAGEAVASVLEVRTVESRGSEPWLLREQFRSPDLKVDWSQPPVDRPFTDDEVIRVYQLAIEALTPESADKRLTVALDLKGASPPTRPTEPVLIQVALTRAVRVVPDELFIAVGDRASLPEERVVALVSDRAHEGLIVSVEDVSADWLEVGQPEYGEFPSPISAKLRVRLRSVPPRSAGGGDLLQAKIRLRINQNKADGIVLPVTVRVP